MSHIEERWLSTGAVSNRALNNDSTFNMAGLYLDHGTGNLFVGGDSSFAGSIDVDGPVQFLSGINSAADSTVEGDLYLSGSRSVGVTSPLASRVRIRSSHDSGLEINNSEINVTKLVIAIDSTNQVWSVKSGQTGAGDLYPVAFMMNNTEVARVSTDGFDVVGRVKSSNLAGVGNRAVYSDASGVLTNSASDERMKTSVDLLHYGLDEIIRLKPVSFRWSDKYSNPVTGILENLQETLGYQKEIGLLAQDVERIIPEVVGKNSDGTLSLDYAKLVVVLIQAVRELKQECDALRSM